MRKASKHNPPFSNVNRSNATHLVHCARIMVYVCLYGIYSTMVPNDPMSDVLFILITVRRIPLSDKICRSWSLFTFKAEKNQLLNYIPDPNNIRGLSRPANENLLIAQISWIMLNVCIILVTSLFWRDVILFRNNTNSGTNPKNCRQPCFKIPFNCLFF